MNEFIHTFSLQKLFTRDEFESLKDHKELNIRYIRDKNLWTTENYVEYGVRIEIVSLENDSPKRTYNQLHPQYVLNLIITLAKLIYPKTSLRKIEDRETLNCACDKLKKIINKIKNISDVDLLYGAKLYRVDVTKDVVTPSDLYTHEIIKASKKAINRYGYKEYNPKTHPDYKLTWKDEDSMMFKSKRVWGKLYNKKRDLILHDYQSELNELGDCGLLRFEISLLRGILRDDYNCRENITIEALFEVLYFITADGNDLLNKYLVKIFYDGAMVSRSIMKKRLMQKRKKGQWTKTLKTMIDFSDWIRKMKRDDLKYYDTCTGISLNIARFKEFNLSPVQISQETPYIPSFADMLNETIDDKLLNLAWRETARNRKNLVYWKFN